ncbi:hypothetical protein HK405_009271, partial [Cladochytrium tenue]
MSIVAKVAAQGVLGVEGGPTLTRSNSFSRSAAETSAPRTSTSGSDANAAGSSDADAMTGSEDGRSSRFGLGRIKGRDSGVAMEGLLIRKQLLDRDGTRAKNRRWMKAWCVLAVDSARGVELTVYKVDGAARPDGEVNFDDAETAVSASRDDDRQMVVKISNQTPQTHDLLHSFSRALKPPGHSPDRPFVFRVVLSTRAEFLFQTPTSEFLLEWTKTLNYWAARRSREPLVGSLSNVEYGWADAAWLRRDRELAERAGTSRRDSSLSSARSASATTPATAASPGSMWRRRAPRIEEWVPPALPSKVVSGLSEREQLASMRRMADALSVDIEEHESFRIPIETMVGT